MAKLTEQSKKAFKIFREHLDGLSGKEEQDALKVCEQEYNCETCCDEGYVEEVGDGDNFECDVIGHKRCPDCNND